MKYIIDSANLKEIKEALELGFKGVTANPSMYAKENINFFGFLEKVHALNVGILTAEVIGNNLDEMLSTCDKILTISNDIVIKVNFSNIGLKLINILHKKGVKTACTLIFNVNQASIAINAGADYIFHFIGRNDENGYDGIKAISDICNLISFHGYETKVVAASIKNIYQLEKASLSGCDYCAITFSTLEKAMFNKLTIDGTKIFEDDWNKISM